MWLIYSMRKMTWNILEIMGIYEQLNDGSEMKNEILLYVDHWSNTGISNI